MTMIHNRPWTLDKSISAQPLLEDGEECGCNKIMTLQKQKRTATLTFFLGWHNVDRQICPRDEDGHWCEFLCRRGEFAERISEAMK